MRSSSPQLYDAYYSPSSSTSPTLMSMYPTSSSPSFPISKSKTKAPKQPKPTQRVSATLTSNPRPKSMDMSRILDPAYLPSSSRAHPSQQRHNSPSNVSVFIDTNGEAHDPDYRHFPLTPTRRRDGTRIRRRRNRTSAGSAGGYYGADGRPAWWSEDEDVYDEDAVFDDGEEDEEDEDDSEPFFLSNGAHPQNGARYKVGAANRRRRRSSPGPAMYASSSGYGYNSGYGPGIGNASYGERPQSATMSMKNGSQTGRKRDGSFSTTTTSSAYFSSFAGHSPATTTSTLPTSWESDKGVLGRLWRSSKVVAKEEEREVSEEKEKEKEKEKGGCVMKKIRRLSRGDKEKEKEKEKEREEERQYVPMVYRTSNSPLVSSRPLPIAEENSLANEEEDEEEAEERRQRKEREEWVPTCGQSMKRQWAAFSLTIRFSIFRTQRRITRRLNSLRV